MPFLTALVPLPYRILAIALALAALFGFGFLKGAQHEQAKHTQDGLNAYKQAVAEVSKLVDADRQAAANFAQERQALQARNADLSRKVADLMRNRPKYQDCKVDPDVLANINEQITGKAQEVKK